MTEVASKSEVETTIAHGTDGAFSYVRPNGDVEFSLIAKKGESLKELGEAAKAFLQDKGYTVTDAPSSVREDKVYVVRDEKEGSVITGEGGEARVARDTNRLQANVDQKNKDNLVPNDVAMLLEVSKDLKVGQGQEVTHSDRVVITITNREQTLGSGADIAEGAMKLYNEARAANSQQGNKAGVEVDTGADVSAGKKNTGPAISGKVKTR
jgi:hypothetical protein